MIKLFSDILFSSSEFFIRDKEVDISLSDLSISFSLYENVVKESLSSSFLSYVLEFEEEISLLYCKKEESV